MAVTLVIVWDTDLETPLAVRRVANMRSAREAASEPEKEYGWSPRTSFYQEVDFEATEEGMSVQEKARALQQIQEASNNA